LVSPEIIENSFRLARKHKSAVASMPLKDSLRMMENPQAGKDMLLANTRSVDRSLFKIIQTPQTFDTALIKKAYAVEEDPSLTDDASVFERAGFPVYLFEGSYRNLKITTPEDLLIAQAFLRDRSGL
jgi:2-C-methyl-D-erythritol 4-phosphate cytidylyltransferase